MKAWAPLMQHARVACAALGAYVLVVAGVLTLIELGGGDAGADQFSYIVLAGVAAAGGWIALGLVFNLRALWLRRRKPRGREAS